MAQRQDVPYLPNAGLYEVVLGLALGFLYDFMPKPIFLLQGLADDLNGLQKIMRVVQIDDFNEYFHPFFRINAKEFEQVELHLVDAHKLALINACSLVLLVILNNL